MPRKYMETDIEELERLVSEYGWNRVVLAEIREELEFRTRRRARQLLREVKALLDGEVAMPARPPKADGPEKQIPLIE